MADVRVGINGFGRIGRCALKNLIKRPDCKVVGINDLADIGDLAYLLKYDSVHGWYPAKVDIGKDRLAVEGSEIRFFAEKNPEKIPWDEIGADIVIESTGAFRDR